ncbi:MAG: ERF family protein [Kiritimatiellae bacterium]|nr:ERF family protein [Kiritimatiellia bacterium]
MSATTTTKPADKAQAEAAAKAALAKKREDAALAAKIEEYRRDVPPGIGEVEAELRAKIDELKRKPPVNLYAAIHKAQAQIETVRKNSENPHFKSKYATIDEIWETVRKALNGAGLIVFCTIETRGDKKELTTHVAEIKSGEEVSCSFPIVAQATGPQAIGSAMTYARRYTLTALLEIVTGDGADDDGEAAENHNHTQTAKNPSASAAADALGF